ncbi:hypothetical protein NPS74_13395, partial [Cutibacterium acnes subsp. acnes]|nr:hypothetical protein [Cutibacterium acnes subsp. acnes]
MQCRLNPENLGHPTNQAPLSAAHICGYHQPKTTLTRSFARVAIGFTTAGHAARDGNPFQRQHVRHDMV